MTEAAKTILVVEDENVVAMDLRASLSRLGYSVTDTVGTGERALESVARQTPSLVLMDVHLRGELDGIETAQQIRQRWDVPVVYVTAYSDDPTVRRAQITEPFGYLLKPFDERELNVVIEMSLYRHKAQKEHQKLLQEQAARAAIEKEHRWLQFLAEAGERLAASLDLRVTLDEVARLAVPRLADLAAVHLKDGDASHTVAVHHAAGQADRIWELLRRYPPGPNLPHGYPHVIRTGRPELLSAIEDKVLEATAVDPENLRLLRQLGLKAQLCVPLVIRGESIGAMTLAFAESNRTFQPQDVDHAAELARRCASAIDNARLYQKAQQAIALREEFLSIASHELRTPLASLTLAMQSVERTLGRLGDPLLGRKFGNIMQQFDNLSQLVDRLLDVSRLSAGTLEIRLEEMDLAALVNRVTGRLEESARQAGSSLDVRAPESLGGRWDPLRIEQVLTNLLGNAIKFCGHQPIEIILEGEPDIARLTVCDHGIGIAKEKLPLIFERFERGVSSRNYGGLGLGLYVSRQLVEAHGGSIGVESEPGNGTRFIVTLPRRPAGVAS